MEKKTQNMVKTGDENPVNRTSERERIKNLLKKHWNVVHPSYPSKLAYLFALIDGKQEEEVEE